MVAPLFAYVYVLLMSTRYISVSLFHQDNSRALNWIRCAINIRGITLYLQARARLQ